MNIVFYDPIYEEDINSIGRIKMNIHEACDLICMFCITCLVVTLTVMLIPVSITVVSTIFKIK